MEDSEEGVMVQHNPATNGSLDADLNERIEDERPNKTMVGSLMDDDLKGLSHKNNNCLKAYINENFVIFLCAGDFKNCPMTLCRYICLETLKLLL
jgi:hypothetical protein